MKRFVINIRTFLSLLSTVLCLPMMAQVNAEQVLSIGRNVLSMDDYMLSIQYFNQAIKAKPYLSDPYFFRALAKLNLEDYAGAEADCTLAIERNRFKTESYKLRGFVRQNTGRDSLAIEDYNKGLEFNPHDKYFLFYKGVAEISLNRLNAADSTLSTLLSYYPGYEDGLTARARLSAIRGDTIAALNDLDRAISSSKTSINSLLLRAELNSQRRNWSDALRDMDMAITLHPQEGDLYINRAFLRYNLDDFTGAMSDYNHTLQLDPHNTTALFNRALLRYEVKDLDRAAQDLETVLQMDKNNFHAIYNLGLIELEQGKYKSALNRFNGILKRYPRFYPAYYARAEAMRGSGDMKGAVGSARIAEQLVKEYVNDPDGKPLDRPAIAAGRTHKGLTDDDTADDIEVMEKFNQLVTSTIADETELTYNERIKGRVQDRDIQVQPIGEYYLSFEAPAPGLKATSNYFGALDDFNQSGYLPSRLYLMNASASALTEKDLTDLFDMEHRYEEMIRDNRARPADRLALAVCYTMLKNYDSALDQLSQIGSIGRADGIVDMIRAYANYGKARSLHASHLADASTESDKNANTQLQRRDGLRLLTEALNDYDKALALDHTLVFAHYNKGGILYELDDFNGAIEAYTQAIASDGSFGEAYYNRGLANLRLGNRSRAFADLSKAGELGILQAYNLLKRMK